MKVFPTPKINLGLSVLRRRPDGFHDIETLFVPYGGLRDELEILPSEETSIKIEGPSVDWDPEKDLTMRAYSLLRADFNLPAVSISLKKNIPVGAGLGGGSSDAVAALKILNRMFALGLGDSDLARYAAALGSDCPFFVYNIPMTGSGRGEILEPYELNLTGYEIRLDIPPGVSVNTAEAYSGIVPRDRMDCPPMPLGEALSLPVEEWRGKLVNDFEPTVTALHPEISALKEKFYSEGAVYAAMSGSGAAVFGIFRK